MKDSADMDVNLLPEFQWKVFARWWVGLESEYDLINVNEDTSLMGIFSLWQPLTVTKNYDF